MSKFQCFKNDKSTETFWIASYKSYKKTFSNTTSPPFNVRLTWNTSFSESFDWTIKELKSLVVKIFSTFLRISEYIFWSGFTCCHVWLTMVKNHQSSSHCQGIKLHVHFSRCSGVLHDSIIFRFSFGVPVLPLVLSFFVSLGLLEVSPNGNHST